MSIEKTLGAFLSAFSNLQLEQMMTHYTEDATAFFPINHHPTRLDNKQEITQAFQKVINRIKNAGLTSIKLDPENLQITIIKDTALATFHIRDNGLSRRTLLLTKNKDRWLIQHLHASNAPLEETR